MGQTILTQSGSMRRAFTTNSTQAGTAITNPADRATAPSGEGIIDFAPHGGHAPNAILLKPFAVGSDTNTFLLGVFGWEKIVGAYSGGVEQWTAHLLAAFTCTITTGLTGLAGSIVPATNFYCDTIVMDIGNANVSNEVISPTTERAATIRLDGIGSPLVQISLFMNASVTSANTLYRTF